MFESYHSRLIVSIISGAAAPHSGIAGSAPPGSSTPPRHALTVTARRA